MARSIDLSMTRVLYPGHQFSVNLCLRKTIGSLVYCKASFFVAVIFFIRSGAWVKKSCECSILIGSPRELSSGVCEQHRCRPACADTQSGQRLCYSLFRKYHM